MNPLDLDAISFACIAHRGARGYAPENTLAAFSRAMDMGCSWVELDVYAIEGELLVIHDNTLKRTTNGEGRVMASSLEYLRTLDAGLGQQIPTLAEVIGLIDRRCGINIELKGPGTAELVSRFLNDCCQSGWHREAFLLSAFHHEELAKSDPRFRRGALFGSRSGGQYFDVTRRLKAYSLNIDLTLARQGLVDAAHDQGLKVYVYTVNEPGDIEKMISTGVDGVFTDYPDRVFTALAMAE